LLQSFEPGSPQKREMIWTVRASPDGKFFAAGGGVWEDTKLQGLLRIWELGSHQEPAVFTKPHGCIGSLQFGPDGRTLFSTSSDQTVRAWDFVSGATKNFSIAVEGMSSMNAALSSLSADGRTMATAGWRTGVRLWETDSGKLIRILTNGPQSYYSIRFSQDGRWLAAGRDDGTAELWNTRTWTATSLTSHAGTIWAFAFSPDGQTLAIGCDNPGIQLWDLDTFERVATLEGHTGPVQALDFSADGTVLVSGGSDETIRIWRAPSFAEADLRNR